MGTCEDARDPRRLGSVMVVAATTLLMCALVGCSADVEREAAARAADAFTRGVSVDPPAACARVAPRTLRVLEEDGSPCSQALAVVGLPEAGERREVTVAGHSAQVRYARDTLFLALFDDGWRVTALGASATRPTRRCHTTARWREGDGMRVMFWAYALVIAGGLALCFVVAAAAR